MAPEHPQLTRTCRQIQQDLAVLRRKIKQMEDVLEGISFVVSGTLFLLCVYLIIRVWVYFF